ncbi:hypothetical protein [uncultured Fibrella sp.]|uniref:hypothetical protein n=1 Tax=uncultured Fibrella sp. TaxID=1284596 RepID=UPI0035CC4DF5
MNLKLRDDLIEFYGRIIPKNPGENPQQWFRRISSDPALLEKVKQKIRAAPFNEQIRLAAMRRALAVAGGQRSITGVSGPNNAATAASAYTNDFLRNDQARAKFAREMIDFLDVGFTYSSPENGSIFWTGVDPAKLVKQVTRWNSEFSDELFGQLEANTDARFIDGAFDWKTDGTSLQTTQLYFGKVSERYGSEAKGHVTSVQMWGLRNDSIFTTKELPTLLRHMSEQIAKGKTPNVQDITIVVLDPVGLAEDCKCFTNLDIGRINIVKNSSANAWISGRQDCGVTGQLNSIIPVRVKSYWMERGPQPLSRAALKIRGDYPLIKR